MNNLSNNFNWVSFNGIDYFDNHIKHSNIINDFSNILNIYVEDFGAKGDSITDDTKSINNAIMHVLNINISSVIHFKNKYRITGKHGITNYPFRINNLILYFHQDSEIYYDPDYDNIYYPGSYNHAIYLYGDNIKVTGSLNIRNNAPDILWDDKFYTCFDNKDTTTKYFWDIAVEIRGEILCEGIYGQNNIIEGVTCKNFTTALKFYACGNSKIQYCNIKNSTTTGILFQRCGDNMELCYNISYNGGDDIFAVGTEQKIVSNNINIHNNYFLNTHGSCVALDGYSNVSIYNNYLSNSSSGLIKIWLENDKLCKGYKFYNNYLIDGGRAWNPNFPIGSDKNFTLPWDGDEACAIRMYYYDPSYNNLYYEDIEIFNNIIINPQTTGISIMKCKDVKIYNNKYYKGVSIKFDNKNNITYINTSTEENINKYSILLKDITDIIYNYTNLSYNNNDPITNTSNDLHNAFKAKSFS
jgi:hypothetical protein